MSKATKTKKAVSLEVFIFLAVIIAFFGLIGAKMGGVNMMQTMMNTAYQLLLETVFYIMAIAVIAGAVSGLFSEFGLIALINKIISPLMKPVYDLPGAASMGVLTTYLSDNPAILGLAEDTNFKKYFKKYFAAETYDFLPKEDIIKKERQKIKEEIIFVGDRHHDMEAARINNLKSIFCSYGFGSEEEGKDASYKISSLGELLELLL